MIYLTEEMYGTLGGPEYIAYENEDGVFGVWSPKTGLRFEVPSFAEARRMAKAMAEEMSKHE